MTASILLGLVAAAHAGAWTRDQGDFYAKIGGDLYKPTSYVDPYTGRKTELPYVNRSLGFYGEVGLLRAWPVQVSASLPFSVGTVTFVQEGVTGSSEGRATTSRLGDLRLAAQTAILHGDGLQLAVGVDVKAPLYRNDTVGADYGVYQDVFPKVGDGQIDVTGTVFAGGSVPSTPLWAEAGVGYRHRTEAFVGWDVDLEFVDGVVLAGTVGVTEGRFVGMLKADAVKNLAFGRTTREWVAVGPAALVTVWKGLAVEARVSGELWTRHAPQGVSAGVGVSWRDPL